MVQKGMFASPAGQDVMSAAYRYCSDGERWMKPPGFEQYWRISQERVEAQAMQMFAYSPREKAVDVGCGLGEFAVHQLAPVVAQVVGVEPDEARCRQAQALARNHGRTNVRCVNATLSYAGLPTNEYDIAWCSHVINHIPSYETRPMLENIWRLLKPGGHLGILAAHSQCAEDLYVLSGNANDNYRETVSLVRFNEVVLNGAKAGTLGTHCFALKTLYSLLRTCGFDIRITTVYHDLSAPSWTDEIEFRDSFINNAAERCGTESQKLEFLKQFGSDVCVLAIKR